MAWPLVAGAHEAPTKAELVDEMRGISRTLRKARLRVDGQLAVDERSAIEALNEAMIAYFREDFERAAVQLMQLVSRPGIKRRETYPDALEALGESLAALGLPVAATEHLRESLGPAGQLPSQFARRLTRFLRVGQGRVKPDEARRFYNQLQGLQTENSSRSDWAREAHYELGRSLHRSGRWDEADDVFRAIDDPQHPRFLHALYYLGVSQVARGDLVAATEAFNIAIEAYEGAAPALPGDPEEYLDVDVNGDPREWVELEVDEDAVVGSEEERAVRRLGAAIYLNAARLAAARDDDLTAFQYYRQVPPGDPDLAAALSEATFVLYRRGKFAWCARLVDQLLGGRGDDLSAAQLQLWKGQLLARTEDVTAARSQFRVLGDALESREARFAAESDAAQRVFPAPVLAWSAPEIATGAGRLEANFVEQSEALAVANELLVELEGIRNDPGALPAVAVGQVLAGKLDNRMAKLAERLDKAQASAHKLDDHAGDHSEELASLRDIANMRDAYGRLSIRLKRYADRLATFDGRFRKRLDKIISAEAPNLRAYANEMAAAHAQLDSLSRDLRKQAGLNVDTYLAEARFGEVDVAFWHKQAATQRVTHFINEHQKSQEPLNDVQREADAMGVSLSEKPEPPPEEEPADDEPDDEPDDDESEPADDESATTQPIKAAVEEQADALDEPSKASQ